MSREAVGGEPRQAATPRLEDPVVIGVVATAHGVRGTVRVRAPGGGRHLREGMAPVVGGVRYRILRARETPKGFLVDLQGVEDRRAAASLRGSELVLDRSELDAPDEGEFYVGDLIGLDAHVVDGRRLGNVVDVFDTPAHEVLVIEDGLGETHYVPFTGQHVPEVSIKTGRVLLKPPQG